MDHEKYYAQKSDGSYVIHFPNNSGLSDAKLAEIFSAFGNVLSITNNQKRCGLYYVRYQTLIEVIRSIDGAPSFGIKILPHKHKENTNNVNKTNINSKTNPAMNTEILSDKNQIQVSSVPKDLPNSNLIQPLLNRSCTSINSSDERDCCRYKRDVNSSDSIKNEPMNTALSKKDPVAAILEDQSIVSNACKDLSDCNIVLPLLHKRTNIAKSTSSILDSKKSKEDLKLDSNISNAHLHYTRPLKDVPADNVTHTIPMTEVIVANIHPILCVHHILDFLKKYNPLYASTIKKTPGKGIRYCHIYYADAGDATATMNEFDMSDVYGKSLIVFMPRTVEKAY